MDHRGLRCWRTGTLERLQTTMRCYLNDIASLVEVGADHVIGDNWNRNHQQHHHQQQQPCSDRASAENIMNQLPPDCRDRVFLFLPLNDCLRFGETSRSSLEHVIGEVDRRRREQFLVRPCEEYTPDGETTLPYCAIRTQELPPGDTLLVQNSSETTNGEAPKNTKNNNDTSFLYRMPYNEDLLGALSKNKEESSKKEKPRTWYELPSVLERLEGLYREIPATHPLHDNLRHLVTDLRKAQKNGIEENANPNPNKNVMQYVKKNNVSKHASNAVHANANTKTYTNTNTNTNTNDLPIAHSDPLLVRFADVTYAHRMHAKLLSECTVDLDPVPYEFTPNQKFTVTLERYMGDVLASSCLMGHSYYSGSRHRKKKYGDKCGSDSDKEMYDSLDYGGKIRVVVEGGISLDKWMDHLVGLTQKRNDGGSRVPTTGEIDMTSITGWYQYWVYFHSALLRVSPFSIPRGKQLLAWPVSGLLEPLEFGGRQPQPQPCWFLPSRTYSCFSPEVNEADVIADHMQGLFAAGNQRRFGVLETTLNHFGPLGPAFRGRDRITTHTMMPHKLYVTLLRNHWISWSLNHQRMKLAMGEPSQHTAGAESWVSDSDAWGVVQWMANLQEQSQTTRPMTVKPPLVTIRMTDRDGMRDAQ